MEKEKFFTNNGTTIPSWNSIFGMEIQSSELNSSSEQLPNCFFNPNWDNSMDQGDPFESALSSMVSSPANSNAGIAIPGNGNGDSIVLRELIGRLGSICNSGEVSPHSYMNGNTSANTSCYNTPLNSPPKLNLSIMDHHHHQPLIGNLPIPRNHHQLPFSADPGFAERAARFSRMKESEFPPVMESRKLPRVAVQEERDGIPIPIPIPVLPIPIPIPGGSDSKKSSRLSVPPSQEKAELGDSMEESSVSEQIPSQNNANARKRKSVPKGKGKETPSNSIPSPKDDNKVGGEKEESSGKRSKGDEEEGNVKEKGGKSGNQKQTKENSKPPEPPKDYIHVRARRGQATDSHSLAERVRREKISERMKFLQDLVPGCNKVTGKAVMLDEIINYVQSLQRQVEFLSMKLATVNPRMDMTMEALISKDMRGTLSHNMHLLDASPQPFPYGFQSQLNSILPNGTEGHLSMINPLTVAIHRNSSMKQPQMDGFTEAAAAQVSSFWENDLQSVVQMGLGQNQPQALHGTMGTSQMKVEL